MMERLRFFSYLFANEIRLLLGLYLLSVLTGFPLRKKTLLLSGLGGGVVTVLQAASLPAAFTAAAEILIMTAAAWHGLHEKLNLCLYLGFFYEIGAGLWDFLARSGLGILFHSEDFINPNAPEYLAGIWLVRLGMAGFILFLATPKEHSHTIRGLASAAALLGLLGAVTLSEQKILPLGEEQTGTWIILSMVLLFSVLFYRLSRQREMELEIARLKQEQAETVERDYQALRRTYEDNAKLYHDLHNHIEALYHCLARGETKEALRYCEDLRTPIREVSQTVWTGDKAADCLISNKMALAGQKQIKTAVHIEYPRNTNIRSADLTTILGNLLDNALEAVQTAPEELRFLNLTIRRINAMLIIKVENGCGNAPKQENGTLITSKSDKAAHGWGLKSVQTAADRYDGALTASYRDGVFQAVVTLSFRPVKTD